MKRLIALSVVVVVVAVAASAATPVAATKSATARQERTNSDHWRPHLEQARTYAQQRLGSISFAVRTPRHLYRYGAYNAVRSASVVKAMLMVAYLNQPSIRNRPLNSADLELLEPMVRWSNNIAASKVRDIVGNGALEWLADRVGMGRFATAPSWGSTLITAAGQSKLFLRIDRYVARRHRRTAMRLLHTVVGPQRWGIARARPPGWKLYFKGGWGDGTGAVDHQVALLRHGRQRISLAILTTDNPSHAYGKETLRRMAQRLLRGLGPRSTLR